MAEENKSGSGDLMASGKVVAEATMSVFQQKSVEGVDKKEVAGAAADLLHSASTYGKLDDKPVGQYIDKAEGYLKDFSSGSGGAAPPPPAAGDAAAPKPAAEEPPKVHAPAEKEEGKPPSSSEGFGSRRRHEGGRVADGEEGRRGGVRPAAAASAGGLFKMAQGFMK
ncbi:hypothetical protein OsJ_31096 [Oryza sativa Japonica Group]|uniref:Uncharacterized protein n=1 Tax=Oryza sativa subsp. japonica TaxID=39947 RepID=A3C3L8_ORYSJ|nr:hypothetical protein OsJ_31096 [Oryza sativa Japonica Group]